LDTQSYSGMVTSYWW